MSGIAEVAPIFLAAGLVAYRIWVDRTEGGRAHARLMVRQDHLAFYVRVGIVAAPLLAIAMVVIQGAIVAGLIDPARPGIAAPIGLIGVGLLFSAFALAYRLRPPLAPRWLVDEFEAGTLARPRWDAIDRFQWRVNVIGALAMFAGAAWLAAAKVLG
ncbi:MAG: hypothetical protein U0838_13235 [Chloroflexota bacterium]